MDPAGARFLVTGASRGIGRSLVLGLAGEGARLALVARTRPDLEAVARACRERGADALALPGDVGRAEDARRVAAAAMAALGGIDVLVNDAAVLFPPAPVVATPPEVWEETLRVNVIGTANLVREVVPSMEARGRGLVVNLSSGWGRVAEAGVAPYAASKFAVEALTQALAQELAPGVIVVAVNPGVVDTAMLRVAWGEEAARYPGPDALLERWLRFFRGLRASWHGTSRDL
jgi:NAD(P)-dependent dehydrogenase (short-subunit alcohol dehydrogenase family)